MLGFFIQKFTIYIKIGVLKMNSDSVSYPMRVVLMEKGHSMFSIWLPAKKEGRYVFDPDENGSAVPISIVASDDSWCAVISKDGYFILNGKNVGKSIELQDTFWVMYIRDDKIYTLYSEIEYEYDNVFLPYCIEKHSTISIGRAPTNDICYSKSFISRNHAEITWRENKWYIIDTNSKNGVFLNGKSVRIAPIQTGDVIYIMGLYIIMGVGFIGVNNTNHRISLTSPKVRSICSENDIEFSPENSTNVADTLFERKPRKKYKLPSKEIEIEAPPVAMNSNKISSLLRMGNPLLTGGRAIATGNIFSAISSLVLPALTQGMSEKERKEYQNLRELKYREYLQSKHSEITEEIAFEKNILTNIYPHLSEMLNFSSDKDRLWERRKIDEDFLSLRIGSGSIPLNAQIKYPQKKFELERDYLIDEMYKLAETPALVEGAPIMLSLKNDFVSSIVGNRNNSLKLVQNMIIQLSLTHAYDEVKIIVLADETETEELNYVRYLPHNWDNEQTIRFFASSIIDAQQLSKYLNDKWETMIDDNNSNRWNVAQKNNPAYVVFSISKELHDRIEILKKVIQAEKYSGISVITCFDETPKECSKLISVKEDATNVIDFIHPEIDDLTFSIDKIDKKEAINSMRNVMHTKLKLESQYNYTLPNVISFLDLYGVGKVEHLNPLKRWSDNNPVKSLAAPIGIGTDGKLFTLDLHERLQGPHGLIAGGTGSGKSEFIITYILSMAVNYSPDEIAFILIDYKGGGLTDAFVDKKRGIHLPHVVGTITNLDGAAIQRSLMSINSELKRRQAIFKKAKSETNEGTMDIYDYQKLYRKKKVKEPMPHLFIISDEFAELKKQQPEFMDELISTARIGRSLGVHLILATQKPSGVVNDQIWSNTKFRICLRVADKNDSIEMLKRPEAAEIRNTGRFYLQVGYNELFAMGQSAWCGAEYVPKDEVVIEEEKSVQFIDSVGQIMLNAKLKKPVESRAQGKQIVSIVKYLSDLAKREQVIPKSLWCDPLPNKIDFETLIQNNPLSDSENMTARIGMVDDPEHQLQFPFNINMQKFHHMLLCGSSGSGKSSFIKTMLYSLVSRYSPEEINYYLLDMSGSALMAYSKLPHCGTYLNESNENDFSRLLKMIKNIVTERKKLYAQEEVTSFDAYRRVKPLSLILVIIDNFANIMNFKHGPEYNATLNDYMKDCAPYGIRFIISANHLNEIHSKIRQEFDLRVALQAKDKYDYSDILDTKCNFTVSQAIGRGIAVIEGRPLEVHIAIPDVFLDDQERSKALKEKLQTISESYPICSSIRILPMADANETYEEFSRGFTKGRIPLGYSQKDMKKVAIPFLQLHSMSLYFGNPNGVKPVFSNIITAAGNNGMEVIIVKKIYDSIFDTQELKEFITKIGLSISFLESSVDGMKALQARLIKELTERNVYRDEYCEQKGIPNTDRSRVRKAEKYIRSKTTPLLIIFESFGEICRFEKNEEILELEETFRIFFERTKGYNIFFMAGFYPEDYNTFNASGFMNAYNNQQFCLLFGGRYDKQNVVNPPIIELRRIEKMEPQYDIFYMKYRDEIYPMRMPCGKLQIAETDPDEASII